MKFDETLTGEKPEESFLEGLSPTRLDYNRD